MILSFFISNYIEVEFDTLGKEFLETLKANLELVSFLFFIVMFIAYNTMIKAYKYIIDITN